MSNAINVCIEQQYQVPGNLLSYCAELNIDKIQIKTLIISKMSETELSTPNT